MTDKITEFLLNGLLTDIVVIPMFLLFVGIAYGVYCLACKDSK